MACPTVFAITERMRPSPAAVGDTLTCLKGGKPDCGPESGVSWVG